MSHAETGGAPPAPSQRQRLRELIEHNLPGADGAAVSRLAATARVRQVPSGERVYRQGEIVTLTLLLAGLAAFRRTTVDGQQLTVGIGYPGQLFGMTSVSLAISSVDMIALADSEVATWDGQHLRDAIRDHPKLALDVIDRLALFLNLQNEKLDGFVHQDARRRVTRVLSRHLDLLTADPPFLSRSHLPGLVGTSREMTGRVLRQLELEGTVQRVGRSGLRILRPDRLERDGVREPGTPPSRQPA